MTDHKVKKWNKFFFSEIFHIKKGFYNKKPEKSNDNCDIPFLGATAYNNGITQFYSHNDINNASKIGYGSNESIDKKLFDSNSITVTNNGSVGYAFYQSHIFTCSHDINPLYLKQENLNLYNAMFIITCIEKQRVCFEYARKWRPKRMVKSNLLLPINKKNKPDFNLMELQGKETFTQKENEYIKFISKRVNDLILYSELPDLKNVQWNSFYIKDIASIQSGIDIYESERLEGDLPYISSTSNNNGIGYFVGNNNNSLDSNCLSVNRNGSVGYSFYHSYKALFSNDCRRLKLNKPSKYIGLFISNQITMQKEKYGYGYKMGTARLLKQKIMLPITLDGKPDYDFMEKYMKSLEYKKLKEYLDYKIKLLNG